MFEIVNQNNYYIWKSSSSLQDHPEHQLMSKVSTADETISNIYLFMIAGYETTSTAFAYSTYVLATQREIQNKLLEEIDQNN